MALSSTKRHATRHERMAARSESSDRRSFERSRVHAEESDKDCDDVRLGTAVGLAPQEG